MKCPACDDENLVERLAKSGAVVDTCAACRGIWLDRGEIYLFSRNPRRLAERLEATSDSSEPSSRKCPRCEAALEARAFLRDDIIVDRCPTCEGVWFDQGELSQVLEAERKLLDISLDEVGETPSDAAVDRPAPFGAAPAGAPAGSAADVDPSARARLHAIAAGMVALPNLAMRSVGVLVVLYGLLGLALILLVETGGLSPWAAFNVYVIIAVLQFLLSPFLMDLMLSWLRQTKWVSRNDLPPHLRRFVERVTREHDMAFPYFGIIQDGSPAAFTYGHTPRNMRIVISRGILELLEPEEVEAVVAHELGHGKRWDIATMTVASLVPMFLYTVFRSMLSSRSAGGRDAAARFVPAIVCYLLYLATEYLVLAFSRCREYHADRFAGEVTGRPGALASALVKIAYGLAAQGPPQSSDDEPQARRRRKTVDADVFGALNIFDAKAARALVVAAAGSGDGGSQRESIKSAMQWDLWNPWAVFYELKSTHPLVAKRLQCLSDQGAAQGQEPFVVFDRRTPESYWDEFFVDLAVMFLPILTGGFVFLAWLVAGRPLGGLWMGAFLIALGLGFLLKTIYTYRGWHFPSMSVAALMHKVKVSNVRPIPVRLKGTIIGRGVPGLIWSEDFVLKDKTGIMFLDYRQPLLIWEWLFGLIRAGDYTGKNVTVTGWFRRAPIPYLELNSLQLADGATRHCYSFHAQMAISAVLVFLGILVLFALG